MLFAPKCLAKITVYQSIPNLCKWINYFLLTSWNNFTFQQDGVPSHRSNHTVIFL